MKVRLSSVRRDLLICVAATVSLFLVAGSFDLFERWVEFSRAYEDWELDEIVTATALAFWTFAWFAWRRWRESAAEAERNRFLLEQLRTEVSERRRSQEILREREERLQQATELTGIGHYVWDVGQDSCVFCSARHAALYGFSQDEFLSHTSTRQRICELIHPEDRADAERHYLALRRGEAIQLEYRTLAKDGQVRFVRELGRPVFDGAGRIVQEIGTSQDITEAELAQRQLRQAQKMEAVGQLTGGIAHDFNNLLTVIQGNAELLGDDAQEDPQHRAAILSATQRGAELIDRLLAFARQQALHPRTVDSEAALDTLTELLPSVLGEDVDLEVQWDPGIWPVSADPGQMDSAILNLAINARDAMPDGGTLRISGRNVLVDQTAIRKDTELDPGEYVELSVRDSGGGMSKEVLARAFDPFFTTKEFGKGSGLGLSMVYGFAKQSKGHVVLDSEIGAGTTVSLLLPRATGGGESEQAHACAEPEVRLPVAADR